MVKAAAETKELKGSMRYAKDHQEQQGYFEEGMQLIYHYGVVNGSASRDAKLNDTRRAKRAHPEEAAEVRIDVSPVGMRELDGRA